MKPSITAIIIAKDEAEMIGACLDTLQWCDEQLVIDDASRDETASVASKRGARVVSFSHSSFARKRTEALKYVSTGWVVYIDADERVTPPLAKEILLAIELGHESALTIKRDNIFYGSHLQFGGWGSDSVTRVFRRSALSTWHGDVHESPVFTGGQRTLTTPLIHLSHRDTISGLKKTIAWTPMEAEALYQSGALPVTGWTLLRKGAMEFFRRVIQQGGYKDGQVGVIEGVVQAINRVLVYIQVWERQQNPSIAERYKEMEKSIVSEWKKGL